VLWLYLVVIFYTALRALPFGCAAYPFIFSIKPRFRICALDRYRCWQESGSLEAIRQRVFLMLFGMAGVRAVYPKLGGYASGIDAAPEGYGKWSDVRRLWSLRRFPL